MNTSKFKKKARLRRAKKSREQMKELRLNRLAVHRTPRHIYAQIISPEGKVLACASTVETEFKNEKIYSGNAIAAEKVGTLIAKRALNAGVNRVAFDRSGFKYHGRIKALADAARVGGLEF
ncbi:MAG: 50S ribosomal protein L18 [Pseudomonadota bacterium]|nr:50S ribosomal protein L18 [Gammaproteobacteria bacterium]MBU1559158.1 50S ribosomal protein L18 [Gammaproteobacteria bacterium]MBU1628469.1 50S ribosomal protein L18 [Gammaproteobacteria bacterium]MBU1926369.1 50S ribosomal protein L18 [Gammaproteobacteria bacterium]